MSEAISVITAHSIAVRLADEEVPVRAIARSLMLPSEQVREVLNEAVAAGKIIRVPREDWHPHPRGQLSPAAAPAVKMQDDELTANCQRLFDLTKLQAAFMSVLIRRNEVTKGVLHQVVEQNRKNIENVEETDPKMVDVVICHLRKKLKKYEIEVKTLWAVGYYMEPKMRERSQAYINGYHAEMNRNGP